MHLTHPVGNRIGPLYDPMGSVVPLDQQERRQSIHIQAVSPAHAATLNEKELSIQCPEQLACSKALGGGGKVYSRSCMS